jgi:hypothetical protein
MSSGSETNFALKFQKTYHFRQRVEQCKYRKQTDILEFGSLQIVHNNQKWALTKKYSASFCLYSPIQLERSELAECCAEIEAFLYLDCLQLDQLNQLFFRCHSLLRWMKDAGG